MKSTHRNLFLAAFVLTLSTLACAMPNVDALLNPTPKDDFSDSSSGWGTGTDASSSVEYADGGLKIAIYQAYYITWSTPSLEAQENLHMETTVQNLGSDQEAFFGFICNEQGSTNSFYYVGVSPDGYYAFNKSKVAGEDETLKKGTSEVISANAQSMRLGLDCQNGSMTLYVNGQVIDSVSDSSYTNGSIGLFAASDDLATGTTVLFDDFATNKIEK
ncbi:MAG: hypothetical protein IT310_10840 [Anaerolineales bacterium]|nr:hypothetical protein [Anaerolineales bacterium]